MNFFEHQDRARRNTRKLVILMACAVITLIVLSTAAISFLMGYVETQGQGDLIQNALNNWDWLLLGKISLGVGAVVAIGSLYKLSQLSGGGRVVAEAMGGRLIQPQTGDADERKVLNVVEEMALAAGTTVPQVYLIDDNSINAFAAGYKPQDAVIGVTRGCVQLLDRDELQGVIAHEFSHIFNGDMRLNIRLVGILHGILIIGMLGYMMLRLGAFSGGSRSREKNGLPFLAIGISLMVLGYSGTFFGNWIKAAVSRQREFLADSSAVQFTRNPFGIAGALKKIAAHSQGSQLESSHAPEFSHMFFGQAVAMSFSKMMATHPPLSERIKRIEPNWDGKYTSKHTTSTSNSSSASHSSSATSANSAGVSALAAAGVSALAGAAAEISAIDSIGHVSQDHVKKVRQTISAIPQILKDAAHEPYSARALIYCLLLDQQPAIRQLQLQKLQAKAHPATYKELLRLQAIMADVPRTHYLPLLDLSLPSLKQQSPQQYQIFKRNLIILIRADQAVDVFEWSLYRILVHNLDPSSAKQNSGYKLKQTQAACQLLLSVLAAAGNQDPVAAQQAYAAAAQQLGLNSVGMVTADKLQLSLLDKALEQLNQLKPLEKPKLLKAMVACIQHDQIVSAEEAELFRAIADSLDCPVPPLLNGQKLI